MNLLGFGLLIAGGICGVLALANARTSINLPALGLTLGTIGSLILFL